MAAGGAEPDQLYAGNWFVLVVAGQVLDKYGTAPDRQDGDGI